MNKEEIAKRIYNVLDSMNCDADCENCWENAVSIHWCKKLVQQLSSELDEEDGYRAMNKKQIMKRLKGAWKETRKKSDPTDKLIILDRAVKDVVDELESEAEKKVHVDIPDGWYHCFKCGGNERKGTCECPQTPDKEAEECLACGLERDGGMTRTEVHTCNEARRIEELAGKNQTPDKIEPLPADESFWCKPSSQIIVDMGVKINELVDAVNTLKEEGLLD